MPSPETLDILFLMAGAGGLVVLGLVLARVLFKPHYTPTGKIQVQQGWSNTIFPAEPEEYEEEHGDRPYANPGPPEGPPPSPPPVPPRPPGTVTCVKDITGEPGPSVTMPTASHRSGPADD